MEAKKAHPTTIDEYIAQYPEELQHKLRKLRQVIKESAPEAEERISYNMPAYYLNGNLVFFSVNKKHIGIYPKTSGMDAFKEELTPYQGTKSSLHFALDQPLPYELISKIVKVRVAENLKAAQAKVPAS